MPLQILRPEDIPGLTKIRGGIIGLNGTGKTTFLTTIPKTERVFHVGVDIENIRPVAKLPNFRIGRLNRWNDLLDVYDIVASALSKPDKAPTVLTFDTWSRLQDLAIGKVTGYDPSDPSDPRFRTFIDRIPKAVQDWRGWNQVGALMNEWMANFNRLPIHIIYLMQELPRKDRVEPTEWEIGPRLTPEAAKGIKDSLELIGRLYVDIGGSEVEISTNGKEVSDEEAAQLLKSAVAKRHTLDPNAVETRKLFVGRDDRYFAKGPTHLLGRVITNPTWDNTVAPILSQTPLPDVARRLETSPVGSL